MPGVENVNLNDAPGASAPEANELVRLSGVPLISLYVATLSELTHITCVPRVMRRFSGVKVLFCISTTAPGAGVLVGGTTLSAVGATGVRVGATTGVCVGWGAKIGGEYGNTGGVNVAVVKGGIQVVDVATGGNHTVGVAVDGTTGVGTLPDATKSPASVAGPAEVPWNSTRSITKYPGLLASLNITSESEFWSTVD